MGKPFEITYNVGQWNAPSGGVATQWTSPFGGLNVQAPENLIGPQYTPDMNNMMLKNGEIRSKPNFKQLLPGPDGVNPILGVGSFLSANQIWHTVSMTPRGLFQLVPNWQGQIAIGQNPWVYLGGPPLATAPLVWQAYAGNLYYTNGWHLSAWDGAAQAPINDVAFLGTINPPPTNAPGWTASKVYAAGAIVWDGTNIQQTTAGGTAGTVTPSWNTVYGVTTTDNTVTWTNMGPCLRFGGLYLGELDSHILLAYVTETAPNGSQIVYPQRIRWSNNGFNPQLLGVFGANLGTIGATFDSNITVNAGFNDFLDVPDILTGMMTIGRVGYLFRQNGITEVSPTGKGAAPFDFNHMWASQNGIGNVYPFSIAQYGSTGMFISAEQVYQMTPSAMQPVGGAARDAIMFDLAQATAAPKASIERAFTLGFSYLTYHLRIPMGNNTRSYVYSIEDNHWMRWTETGVTPTGSSNVCWV